MANLSVSYNFKWSDIAQVISRSKIHEFLNQILVNDLAKIQGGPIGKLANVTTGSNPQLLPRWLTFLILGVIIFVFVAIVKNNYLYNLLIF